MMAIQNELIRMGKDMSISYPVSSCDIRSAFSKAMSAMYKTEVPAYGTLMELVAKVNADTLAADPALKARLDATDNLERISEERHGAIRHGTAAELAMMRRVFAVMGMSAWSPFFEFDFSIVVRSSKSNDAMRVFLCIISFLVILVCCRTSARGSAGVGLV